MSKDANVEKLTEKHQQTQSAIKNLQKVEEGIFANLEKLKKGGKDKSEKKKLLEHINNLSIIRENLFKDLKVEYEKGIENKLGQAGKLSTQTNLINMSEKRLNSMKKSVSRAKDVRANRKRMIEIGDYEFSRYEEHKALMKIVAFTSLGILLSVFAMKQQLLSEPLAKAGIIASGVIGTVFLIYKLIDVWYRSNVDYNKYDWGMWYSPGPPETWKHGKGGGGGSILEHNKKGVNRIFWGDKGSKDEKKTESDLAGLKSKTDAPKGDAAIQVRPDGVGVKNFAEQLHALFNKDNCPKGAEIRGYCAAGGSDAAKAKAEEKIAAKGGVKNPKLTEEEVEGQAKAKTQAGGLKFDKINITGKDVEAFEGRAKSGWRGSGTKAGAGDNLERVVVPFAGFT
jgi:hypothetical protein